MDNTIKTNNDEIKVRDESGSISEVTEELLAKPIDWAMDNEKRKELIKDSLAFLQESLS